MTFRVQDLHWRPQRDPKDLVLVFALQRHDLSSSVAVPVQGSKRVVLGNELFLHNLKSQLFGIISADACRDRPESRREEEVFSGAVSKNTHS